jgi:hypothetical protein
VEYEGMDSLSLDENGVLHAKTALGEVVDKAPVVYQETAQGRTQVAARYRLINDVSYGFELIGSYDESLPVVLDPDLAWGTFFGMTHTNDHIRCEFIGTDNHGRVEVALTPWIGAPGDSKVRVAQFAATGELLWDTYLDGGGDDGLSGASFGPDGTAYLVGQTSSADFPVVDAFQEQKGGGIDFFVAKVAPDGHVVYASYLGGSGEETMCPYGKPRPVVVNTRWRARAISSSRG